MRLRALSQDPGLASKQLISRGTVHIKSVGDAETFWLLQRPLKPGEAPPPGLLEPRRRGGGSSGGSRLGAGAAEGGAKAQAGALLPLHFSQFRTRSRQQLLPLSGADAAGRGGGGSSLPSLDSRPGGGSSTHGGTAFAPVRVGSRSSSVHGGVSYVSAVARGGGEGAEAAKEPLRREVRSLHGARSGIPAVAAGADGPACSQQPSAAAVHEPRSSGASAESSAAAAAAASRSAGGEESGMPPLAITKAASASPLNPDGDPLAAGTSAAGGRDRGREGVGTRSLATADADLWAMWDDADEGGRRPRSHLHGAASANDVEGGRSQQDGAGGACDDPAARGPAGRVSAAGEFERFMAEQRALQPPQAAGSEAGASGALEAEPGAGPEGATLSGSDAGPARAAQSDAAPAAAPAELPGGNR